MFIVPVSRASRPLSRLFDDTVERVFAAPAHDSGARSPALDVAESDTAYTVRLEVPGVAKEDVKVSVEGRRVTVQAQAPGADERAAPAPTDRIVYRERPASRYSRSLTLPVEVEQGEAGAKLENGVLTLTLPKRNARAAAQITIN